MAAATITRDAWTNDTGTALNPNLDGTVINNNVLQNHIYARIDEMFAGAGAYATFTLGGLFAADGFGVHAFNASGAGGNRLRIRNLTAGTGNYAGLEAGNDFTLDAVRLLATSTTFTTSGAFLQNAGALTCNLAGGWSVAAAHADGVIRFYSGGSAERMRLTSAGNVMIGHTGSGTPRRVNIVGQGTTLGIVDDAGDKLGGILLASVAGNVGDGGMIEFGFGYGTASPSFAALKGYGRDSTGGTLGDITLHLRPAAATTSLTERFRFALEGHFFVNDTSNGFLTQGITINQAGYNNEILTVKSSDVAHAFTVDTETDSYGHLRKSAPASGGLSVAGYTSDVQALQLNAQYTTGDTTKGGAAKAAIVVTGNKLNVNTAGAMGANENIICFRDNNATRFILDADGDSHQDVGTAWTNYDDRDDVLALNALAYHVARADDPYKDLIRARFGRELDTFGSRATLAAAKLVTFHRDGHHFVNMSKLAMLHTGAIRQLGDHVYGDVEERLARLERHLLAA